MKSIHRQVAVVWLGAVLLMLIPSSGWIRAQGSQTGWRMDGFNPQRTNRGTVAGPQANPVVDLLAGNVVGSLRRITDDGLLIVGGTNAVAAYDGTVTKWQIPFAGLVDVAIGSEQNVYLSTATSLEAVDKDTGSFLWTSPYVGNNGNESSSLAIASDGTVFFHTGATFHGGVERLAALLPDGTVKWERSLTFRGYPRVVMSNDESVLYLPQGRVSGGTPFITVSRISTTTGEVINDSACAISDWVHLYDAGQGLYASEYNTDNTPQIVALPPDLSSCTRFADTGTGPVVAVTAAGVLIQRTLIGEFLGFSRAGELLWSSVGEYADVISDSDGVLYATSRDLMSVTAIDSTNGTVLWTEEFRAQVTGLLLGGDGNLYLTAGMDLMRISGQPMCQPPTITGQPNSAAITNGQSWPLVVTATGMTPLAYQWYRGFSGDTSSPVASGTGATVLVSPSSTTNYWVRVANQCGSLDSDSVTVTVQPLCVPPLITRQPLSSTIESGRSATLHVTATGVGLKYQWYRGTSGNTSSPIAGANSATYVTGPLDATTSYWVRITNGCGMVDSDTAAIHIPRLVVLVHGGCGSPSSFGQMEQFLREELRDMDATVASFSYAGDSSSVPNPTTRRNLRLLSAALAKYTVNKMDATGAAKVDFVTHSLGGLLVRAWQAGLAGATWVESAKAVRRVITIGTPHHGLTDLDGGANAHAWFSYFGYDDFCSETDSSVLKEQVSSLAYGSDFLQALNEKWVSSERITPSNVLTIVGCGGFLSGPSDNGDCQGDGLVQAANATLPIPSSGADYHIAYVLGCHIKKIRCAPGIADVSSTTHATYRLVKSVLRNGVVDEEANSHITSAPGLIMAVVTDNNGQPLSKKVSFSDYEDQNGDTALVNCSNSADGAVFDVHAPASNTGSWLLTQRKSVNSDFGVRCWELMVSAKKRVKVSTSASVPFGRPVWLPPVVLPPAK